MSGAVLFLPNLPPFRRFSINKNEYGGPCPFCRVGGPKSDRMRIWPNQRRYWCRQCERSGWLDELTGERRREDMPYRPWVPAPKPPPDPTDVAAYRALYTEVALWAHVYMLEECNPDPRSYLHKRGLSFDTISTNVLGATPQTATVLPEYLKDKCPELLPYAEAAGVLTQERGQLVAHRNLRDALVLPYFHGAEIVDLRTRSFHDKSYRSLPGAYEARGAIYPFGWQQLPAGDTIILTEGEIKALAVQQAFRDGQLPMTALAHPGLTYLRPEWPARLRAQGVQTVILAYDSQPRPIKDGILQLAPEESWSVKHGQTLEAAGLDVRVLRLPLAPGETKWDLDAFLLAHPPAVLAQLIAMAPSLRDYQRSLPQSLQAVAKLPPINDYPQRRGRPQRRADQTMPAPAAPALSLEAARTQIVDLVTTHVAQGRGILTLAHPPGTGKGHGTTQALAAHLQHHPDQDPIVWAARRKDQIKDQEGLTLTLIEGRNSKNCQKIGEAQALAAQGYTITRALCARRCPIFDTCTYHEQLRQPSHRFASQTMLLSTPWWATARALVLDEFDPAILTRLVTLDLDNLLRMGQANNDAHGQTILRWLMELLVTTSDRQLTGTTLLNELHTLARAEGLDLAVQLKQAIAALPSQDEVHRLPGLPPKAELSDYQELPPNYLGTIFTRLAHEHARALRGEPCSSRLEVSAGELRLYLRNEHLIQALARAEQPKIILDATVNTALLRAIFPGTPLHVEQPQIAGGAVVRQVITRDWAKSTLHGARREQWFDAVASHIRPGRPTLVVCTKDTEEDLGTALIARGHTNVVLAHYGNLRGTNAFKGYDVILSQVYHPNLEAIIREGRALFADDPIPLDERMQQVTRTLTDATGACWHVQVPTFVDPRLAALLEQRRESELVQAALRGRPFDHPETQVTLLFSLPLAQLPPTTIIEDVASPASNQGRMAAARDTLAATVEQLIGQGARVISVEELAAASGQSEVTVRKHLAAVAGRLRLELVHQRRIVPLRGGGQRAYIRTVIRLRGRFAPPPEAQAAPLVEPDRGPGGTDHACNSDLLTGLICGGPPPGVGPRPAAGLDPGVPSPGAGPGYILEYGSAGPSPGSPGADSGG